MLTHLLLRLGEAARRRRARLRAWSVFSRSSAREELLTLLETLGATWAKYRSVLPPRARHFKALATIRGARGFAEKLNRALLTLIEVHRLHPLVEWDDVSSPSTRPRDLDIYHPSFSSLQDHRLCSTRRSALQILLPRPSLGAPLTAPPHHSSHSIGAQSDDLSKLPERLILGDWWSATDSRD